MTRESYGARSGCSCRDLSTADFRFCPTGGIDLAGAPDFLALPNVACVGGSWITPKDAVDAGDWSRIETLAREAAQLGTT